jgi:hypothetical protein
VWASPVVATDVVYLGDAGGTDARAARVDGTTAWSHRHGVPIYGDAALDPDGVSFVDERSMLTRLDRAHRRLRWQVRARPRCRRRRPRDFTFTHRTPRPAIAGRRAVRRRAATAAFARSILPRPVLWRCALDGAVMSGIAVAARHLVAGTFDRNAVVAIDPPQRAPRCGRFRRRSRCRRCRSSPTAVVLADAAISASTACARHGCAAMGALVPVLRGSSPRRRWSAVSHTSVRRTCAACARFDASGRTLCTTDVRGLTWGTPALAGDRIYAGTAGAEGRARGPSARRGARSIAGPAPCLWRRELPMGDARMAGFASSLAVAGARWCGATVDGTVCGIPAGRVSALSPAPARVRYRVRARGCSRCLTSNPFPSSSSFTRPTSPSC